ncbi:MAG: sortase [Candidatus Saccharimonadales bacterium]
MTTNPLFPDDPSTPTAQGKAAVELIRAKVARAFSGEPDTSQEIKEAKSAKQPSKHQLYMRELSASGQSLAEIQTAWHHYYSTLNDVDKREVWDEFYEANQHTPYSKLFQQNYSVAARRRVEPEPLDLTPRSQPKPVISYGSGTVSGRRSRHLDKKPISKKRAAARKIKAKIVQKVTANGQLKVKHHFQSILFGLGIGLVTTVMFLFSFFNEYIIAPFIQPSRTVSATPVILGGDDSAIASTPKVIIPKINVEVPIDFSLTSNSEDVIENSLANGTVHYPSTAFPGEIGNVAIFGHSSRNIFNSGKYKFAFVLLHTLTTGDLFYITYNGKVYAYQVFTKEVVPPSQVSVLNDTKGKTSTAVLITCDPPGFSTNRMVIWGEQISPDPTTNTLGQAPVDIAAPAQIASNGPSTWSSFVNWITFWN